MTLDFAKLREDRAAHPEKLAEIYSARSRRNVVQGDGRLFIIAADHPARNALSVRDNARAMENRYDLIERLATALSRPGVDGVLGTPDIIDDLALLGCLEGKLVVGSLNRGGLRGASFEMDDRITGYDINGIVRDGLDFAKMLNRVNLGDAGTSNMLEYSHNAVSQAAAAKLPIMLEPFMSEWVNGKIRNDLSTDAVIDSISIASALGNSSAYTWMKLPVVENMARVMESTTLPTLLLGGDPVGDPKEIYDSWGRALELPGVRGLVVGRSLLYPQDGNVAVAIDTAVKLVHG
ncbi:deoxyribose-phosphate aldolase [Rhodoluna sp.]|uniref:class I fructose-bisphosphate aldolase n=1 Tax=Rhodoluna sp. TaxID=1969481 RepID=UPI0025F15E0A|nr:deoxyribose-phosphate aldolase [Rhodoluna sp.]